VLGNPKHCRLKVKKLLACLGLGGVKRSGTKLSTEGKFGECTGQKRSGNKQEMGAKKLPKNSGQGGGRAKQGSCKRSGRGCKTNCGCQHKKEGAEGLQRSRIQYPACVRLATMGEKTPKVGVSGGGSKDSKLQALRGCATGNELRETYEGQLPVTKWLFS